jgi:hypothetical protein
MTKQEYLDYVSKLTPKEYYDHCQQISQARGLPSWTTWEEYYELLEAAE